jgi:hypothetical protein
VCASSFIFLFPPHHRCLSRITLLALCTSFVHLNVQRQQLGPHTAQMMKKMVMGSLAIGSRRSILGGRLATACQSATCA